MNFFGKQLNREPNFGRDRTPACPPNGRYVAGSPGHFQKSVKKWSNFAQFFQLWGVYCNWWVHILARAPGDERHLYRLSIHGSIDFGPCV